MNFLAHLYLAGVDKEIMIGNFIADSIRGNKFHHFSEGIKFGIKMHRAIDTFTDEHSIFRQSKRRLDPKYRLYKGVIIDLIYDHFLAKNWLLYSEIPLQNFSQGVYQTLKDNYAILPEKTQYLLPYMTQQNWLYMYRTIPGITSILHDMNVRTKGISMMNEAVVDLKNNYAIFEQDFTAFFEELQIFSQQYLLNYDRKNN
ncbi:acyl carrier protein phosphodiesterase [Wenyingzhuangia heitensis]|uniref:Acyl carrier protein phosphodiesterase n=1 Tax=Wenyingzhuangia heitensis TaxID=1487859 RepID=A0ABX0U5V7_9FLAO|nr:acyl carrier protein phosphodiesterase [Wenyingzhuangia heitensis]NIJ44224.1 acyl carrier protein phosphodiesterase [Wenyingzhuangia heitensis]